MEHSEFLDFLKAKRFNFNLQSRVEESKATRRSCRTSVALKMRNIGIMTPIESPIIKKNSKADSKIKTENKSINKVDHSPKKQLKFDDDKSKKDDASNRRMQMFKEWKKEKDKRLRTQKAQAKPLFKVQHVAATSSYNLDQVYGTIKGKSVDTLRKKNSKAQFVPIENHKFKAPANVKAISFDKPAVVKKPIVESKIPHRMILRPKNNGTGLPISNVGGELKPKSVSGKTQNVPLKKVAAKKNGSIVIGGRSLHVLAEKLIKDNGIITVPKKKLLSVNGNNDVICDSVSESIQTHKNSANGVRLTRVHRKLPRRNENVDVVVQQDNKVKQMQNEVPLLREVEVESGHQQTVSVKSSDKNDAEKKVKKVNNKRKSFVQSSKELVSKIPEIHVISDSEEEKSHIKENRTRKRWSLKENQKSPFKTERRTRQQKRDSTKTEEIVLSSSEELIIENKKVMKRGKRKVTAEPLKEENSSNNSSLSTAYTIEENSSLSEGPITPKNKDTIHSYVSPFVTMSRGKENARKEFHRRSTLGGEDYTKSTSPKAAAKYFTHLLEEQNRHLMSLCAKWNAYKLENSAEEVHDMINVAVGQTELLLNKKFKQFKELIGLCESGKSEKPIKSLDLHGYYDTMQIQIVNLEKRFENLDNLKSNNWEEIAPSPKKVKVKVKKVVKKSAPSALRAMIAAKRKELNVQGNFNDVEVVQTPNNKRISRLRKSICEPSPKKRISSPGLAIMKATQVAKSTFSTPKILINTQPKSILKSEGTKSIDKIISRKSKMVLFQDSCSPPPSKIIRRSCRKISGD